MAYLVFAPLGADMTVQNLISSLSVAEEHHASENLTRLVYMKCIKQGDIVLDVGANRGDHTHDLSRLVGGDGKVHAFEPNTAHFLKLLGVGANVRLWPVAVGQELCLQTLHIPDGLDGWASLEDLTTVLPDTRFSLLKVPQITVDSVLDEIDPNRVSFIKIDVESREKEAIIGMRELLRRSRSIVVLENMNREIEKILVTVEYTALNFTREAWADQTPTFTNVVALPNEKVAHAGNWLPAAAEIHQTIAAARLFFAVGLDSPDVSNKCTESNTATRIFAFFQRLRRKKD